MTELQKQLATRQYPLEEAPKPQLPALIVGLGNPGSEYASHRHNIGFRVVEALARAHGLTFRREKGSKAHVASGQIGGREVILAKPQTFMNLSGQAVGRVHRAHKISPENLLVVYDDLDLPLGRLRLRPEGGSGGHKGMRTILDTLGTQAFPRLRVGIDRPAGRMDPAEYVLQPFAEEERPLLPELLERAVAATECWLAEGIVAAMDRFNRPALADAEKTEMGAHAPAPAEQGPMDQSHRESDAQENQA